MNNSIPVVSVLLPTYNRAHLLPDVIASILGQDFDDLELIIVDDGSTDETTSVVQEIRERDGRLHYVRLPENRGLGFARDAGLRYANAEYIALADSDDRWISGRLRSQVDLLERYSQIDIIFGDFLDIDHLKNSKTRGFIACEKGFNLLETRLLEEETYEITGKLETALLISNFIAAPTMILKKKVFDLLGGFNESLAATDLEFAGALQSWVPDLHL